MPRDNFLTICYKAVVSLTAPLWVEFMILCVLEKMLSWLYFGTIDHRLMLVFDEYTWDILLRCSSPCVFPSFFYWHFAHIVYTYRTVWTNTTWNLTWAKGMYFSEIWITIEQFANRKMCMKISINCWPFRLGFQMLIIKIEVQSGL